MNYGLRRRLMILFIIASGLVCFVMLCISTSYIFSTNLISSSYESNRIAKNIQNKAFQVEQDLETYIDLRNYENINRYFQSRAKFERLLLDLHRKPSENEELNCQYFVRKFGETFLAVADSAIYENRAGNTVEAAEEFLSAQKVYTFLSSEIEKMNQIYFDQNIKNYVQRRRILHQVVFFGTLFLVFSVLIIIVAVYFIVSDITRPLVEISDRAEQLAGHNFEVPLFEYSKKDEIGNICRAMNKMIISIREYVDTIWEKAIRENELREKEMKMNELYQDAKLNALQAQINPHFLFNTLNTGAQLAMLEGSDRTCDFLEKVADFYRYNLQYTGQESDLESEIQMLESYIYIMKVRFGSRFDFFTDIQYPDLSVKLPGMILQPLVENCIKYGLADKRNGGKITLAVRKNPDENIVLVSISDNGIGFPEVIREKILKGVFKKQESVLESKGYGSGVGISNVISRLRLYFKRDDVFDIQNPIEGGSSVIIKVYLN